MLPTRNAEEPFFLAAIMESLVPATALTAEVGVELHRLYNPFTGEHFYTRSVARRVA